MDKNTIIGFVLIAAVLFGFTWFNQPSREQMEAKRIQDSTAAAAKAKADEQRKIAEVQRKADAIKAAQADSTALFHTALTGTAQRIVLQNEKVALTLSSKGATVEKAVIRISKITTAIRMSPCLMQRHRDSTSCLPLRKATYPQPTCILNQ